MLLLDYEKGVAKSPIKLDFFVTPSLREGKGRKEERGQRSKTTPPFLHCFYWGLKNGQEVVPPFWAQKFQFLKTAKNDSFKAFPGKAGGSHSFLGKAILERGQKQKM